MRLRTVLLAGIFALAANALHAEEFQMTIQGAGFGCPNGQPPFCDPSVLTTVPVAVTGDFNTLNGMVSATFAHNPPGGPSGDIVDSLNGSAPLTNFTEIVGGHNLASAANSSLSFGCIGFPISPNEYECGGEFGGVSAGDIEVWMSAVTQAQYQSFKDPLASLLLMDPGFECTAGGVSGACEMDGGPFGTLAVQAAVTFTPVPAPGPLSLFFLAGVLGLALSRHRRLLSVLPSRS